MLKNYHSHTARCGHAWGTDEEFVNAAIDAGFGVLGFSEHTAWPFVDGYQEIDTRQRIKLEELERRAICEAENAPEEISAISTICVQIKPLPAPPAGWISANAPPKLEKRSDVLNSSKLYI